MLLQARQHEDTGLRLLMCRFQEEERIKNLAQEDTKTFLASEIGFIVNQQTN